MKKISEHLGRAKWFILAGMVWGCVSLFVMLSDYARETLYYLTPPEYDEFFLVLIICLFLPGWLGATIGSILFITPYSSSEVWMRNIWIFGTLLSAFLGGLEGCLLYGLFNMLMKIPKKIRGK